ncbi:MAG: alpha/beta hydrolase [Planctomycetota bacterium]
MSERLVFLPGLGADARLFEPQLAEFQAGEVISWPDHNGCKSIGDLAERVLETGVCNADTRLVGFSFGSMVALEMACRAADTNRPPEVVLISGLRSRRALTLPFKLQAWAAQLAPRSILRKQLVGPVAESFKKRDGVSDTVVQTLSDMAADCDLGFLKWALRACARWTFDGRCPVPVRQLHGRSDTVIPLVEHPDLPGGRAETIEGGHLLTLTSPDAVNRFIAAGGPG